MTLRNLDGELLRKAAIAAGYAPEQTVEYLLDRRLAHRRGKDVDLRLGAVLLFAARPASIPHPHADVRVFVVDGTERKTGARHNVHERARIEGALPRVIERTNETLRGLIKRSARLHDLFFVEQAEYPTFAWQEAIVNAVAHRDYRNQGRGIEVWYFDDRIELESPGPLVPDVEIKQRVSRKPVRQPQSDDRARAHRARPHARAGRGHPAHVSGDGECLAAAAGTRVQ